MTSPTERHILANLRSLQSIDPTEGATRAALATASASLRQSRDTRNRTLRRIIMRTSLAACLAILVAIAWFTFAPQRATAAETLARAAAATQAYKGWVRIHFVDTTASTNPVLDGSASTMTYVDRATGTTIHDNTHDGDRDIQIWDVTSKREVKFDSRKNRIDIGDITDSFARGWSASMVSYPITLSDSVARLKEQNLDLKITESNENNLKRLDVTFPRQPQTQPSKDNNVVQMKHSTLWIDPKTDLVQRVNSESESGAWTIEYTYVPPIRDIYDLHVARDTKVFDHRITGELNAVFDRLQKRYERGFGDFVALDSEMDIQHPEKPDRNGAINLYAASADKWLYMRFLVGQKQYGPRQPRDVAIGSFDAWPPKDCRSVLDRIEAALPSNFVVSNGKHVWTGQGVSRKDYHSEEIASRMKQTIEKQRAEQTLPGFIWPTRMRLGLFGAVGKATLIQDVNKHPGQLGLHVEQVLFDATQKNVDESTYWLDPSRDDMPIEWFSNVSYGETGKTTTTQSHVQFLEWKQLPGGAWYPTRWKSEDAIAFPNEKPSVGQQEHVLILCPGLQLGDEWFTDPAAKLKH